MIKPAQSWPLWLFECDLCEIYDYRCTIKPWWLFTFNHLLFADDTTLVADSEQKLCRLVNEFGRVCERRKLRVNVGRVKLWGGPGMVMGTECMWY